MEQTNALTNRYSKTIKNDISPTLTEQKISISGAGVMAKTRYDHSSMSLLSIPQAVECLGVSRATFYRLLDRKEIRSFHIGRRRFVTQEALSNYIQTQEEAENYGW